MSDQFSFHPVAAPALLFSLLFVCAVTLLWFEWKKSQKYRALRMTASLLTIVALLGVMFRPHAKDQVSKSVVVLTKGFKPSTLDSLVKKFPGLNVVAMPGVQPTPYKNLESVQSLEDIKDQVTFVLGFGFDASGLDIMDEQDFESLNDSLPTGIIDVTPVEAVENEAANIFGISNFAADSTEIVLKGPDGRIDSVVMKKGLQPFSMSFMPKQAGNFAYALTHGDQEYEIPIEVREKTQLRILFLQQYPTFETRYLKEWLGKKHALAFRYELSRNVFRFENLNRPHEEIRRISKDVLDKFDVLIIEASVLQQLSSNERKLLQREIDAGFGMVILWNELPAKQNTRDALIPFEFAKYDSDTTAITIAGKTISLPAWPISVKSYTSAVIKNRNRILTGYSYHGFGKIGYQLLQETFRISLGGDSARYQKLWSGLIERTARSKNVDSEIRIQEQFPIYPNTPVEIEVITTRRTPEVAIDSIPHPLIEDAAIDGIWSTKTWFDEPGWHQIATNDGAKKSVYVSKPGNAQSLSEINSVIRSKKCSVQRSIEQARVEIESPVPPIVFYVLFLMSVGCLWLVPKI